MAVSCRGGEFALQSVCMAITLRRSVARGQFAAVSCPCSFTATVWFTIGVSVPTRARVGVSKLSQSRQIVMSQLKSALHGCVDFKHLNTL